MTMHCPASWNCSELAVTVGSVGRGRDAVPAHHWHFALETLARRMRGHLNVTHNVPDPEAWQSAWRAPVGHSTEYRSRSRSPPLLADSRSHASHGGHGGHVDEEEVTAVTESGPGQQPNAEVTVFSLGSASSNEPRRPCPPAPVAAKSKPRRL